MMMIIIIIIIINNITYIETSVANCLPKDNFFHHIYLSHHNFIPLSTYEILK
jgi:hypothetical protein